jgi:hypothetical protein
MAVTALEAETASLEVEGSYMAVVMGSSRTL